MDPISNEIRKAIRDIDATATMENIIEQLKNKFPDQRNPGFEAWVKRLVEASRRETPPSPTNEEVTSKDVSVDQPSAAALTNSRGLGWCR